MPRRILLFITDLLIGGTPTVVRELALRLGDEQTHVQVACLSTFGPVARQLSDAGVRVTPLSATRAWHLPRAVRQLRELLVEQEIDTVISFLIHANFVATLAVQSLPQVRLIQSIQTTQPTPRWHWWLQGRIHLSADTILAPSQAIVTAAGQRSAIPADRFTIIPNAIDADSFVSTPVFQRPPLRVGFLGRIDPIKRVELAIQAVSQQSDMTLEIFGDGPARSALWQRYAGHGNIHWHGSVPQPQVALGQMDVLILPSLGEGFGLVVIEAMACGVPVVASAAGALSEIVTHEQTGLLVPVAPGERDGFANALRRLQNDPPLRKRLIDNAQAHVKTHHAWPAVLAKYRAMLDGLLRTQ